jgi:hypothetical protein
LPGRRGEYHVRLRRALHARWPLPVTASSIPSVGSCHAFIVANVADKSFSKIGDKLETNGLPPSNVRPSERVRAQSGGSQPVSDQLCGAKRPAAWTSRSDTHFRWQTKPAEYHDRNTISATKIRPRSASCRVLRVPGCGSAKRTRIPPSAGSSRTSPKVEPRRGRAH